MIGFRRLAAAGLALLLAGCSNSPPELVPAAAPGSASSLAKSDEPQGGGAGESGFVNSSLPAPAGTKANVREILEEARKTADSGNFGGAAALLEEVVKLDPGHREALLLLATVNQERASVLEGTKQSAAYHRSAWAMRQIRSRFKKLDDIEKQLLPIALYNEADAFAREGTTESALKSLGEAVDAGFANPDKLRTDRDLEPLRKRPEFQGLVDRAEKLVREQAAERTRSILGEKPSFPFAFDLPGVDGKKISSRDYRGKVLIVDFWGTWCPPCRKEIPHFIALLRKYHDQGLEIVGINYEQLSDEKEIKQTIASFIKENGIPYPCVLGDDETKGQVRGFQGFPTTLYIDRAGTVRGKVVGFNPDDAVDSRVMEELVTTLLAEPAPGEPNAAR